MRLAIFHALIAAYLGISEVLALPIQDTKGISLRKTDGERSNWEKMIRQRLQRMFSSNSLSAGRRIVPATDRYASENDAGTPPPPTKEHRMLKYPLCYFTAIPCHHRHRVRRHRREQKMN